MAQVDGPTDPLGPTSNLRGLCPLTADRARRGYRLTQFLTRMKDPEERRLFLEDEQAYLARSDLSDAERRMVRDRDFAAMVQWGACTAAIHKANAVFGVTLIERGAKGRGQTAAEFLQQRRAANEGFPWHF